MVLVAVAMVAIIAMAAMSIDLVTLYLAREEAQRAADSAALAAARVISVTGITGTADTTRDPADWRAICGAAGGWATQAAQAVAAQNTVGGQEVTVSVTYSDGATSGVSDCANLSAAFAVNPMVTVQIAPANIPSFFSRIWGSRGNSISASATAEVFNPSASDNTGVQPNGTVTPVQPRCVKPWIVPNLDPNNGFCVGSACNPFVSKADGQIGNPGISPGGTGATGVIGEKFTLFADCGPAATAPCALVDTPRPLANVPDRGTNKYDGNNRPPLPPSLEYLPGTAPASVSAVPSCSAGGSNYEGAVAGCDQTTVYQCGQQVPVSGNPNMIDLSENPGGSAGDTAMGLACSLANTNTLPLTGNDTLRVTSYPFVAIAGDANPLGISGTPVTNSSSIVSLPIYDQGTAINPTGTTAVTIVGFLQVFVNSVSQIDGSVNVTVMNVAGCGSNGTTNPPVSGGSPVAIRLITPH
jgi:hypothetical protein